MDLTGKRFLIDPGHGGDFPEKTYKNRMEKEITLKLSKILRDMLKDEGAARVFLTRSHDKDFDGKDADDDINKRVDYINKFPGVDVLLSIHVNTETGRAGMFYPVNGKASKTLARSLQRKYATYIAHAGVWEGDFAIN
ncbi:N-acetylmuramoyl-L-alanine amidase [Brevibacillus daliensis]|uniref:N-acetylmuramoyl-L-alanine amidase n=1 Tax=Brevibacillus daliensis TaxID=2892995 RepID=UPI001E45D608|nr:N-acetylmuramoyl-L-alanine amidase [Brevibacillus daliensis]